MKGFIAAVAATVLSTAAFGGITYEYATTNPAADGIAVSTAAGTVSSLDTKYTPSTNMFSWNVTFSDGVAKDTDGFWLVVGPGPNPKGSAYEYAIMYFDASSLANPNVTIYRYNGNNGDDSFTNPGQLLATTKTGGQTTIQSVSASQGSGARTFSFQVNATTINSLFGPPTYPDWKGIQFGTTIGIWMHPVAQLTTKYNNSGGLSQFSYYSEGFYDGANTPTVPVPATAALLAMGGVIASRRRRA